MRVFVHRRSVLPLFALLTGGCPSNPSLENPCAGRSGGCITLTLHGEVGPFDALRVIAAGQTGVAPLPAIPGTLPLTIAVPIPSSVPGNEISPLEIDCGAFLNGQIVGRGQKSIEVTGISRVSEWMEMLPVTGPSCSDGFRDGDETDVDCGGSCPMKCGSGASCNVNEDCGLPGLTAPCKFSLSCIHGKCACQCSDGIRDGDESDIDCGGSCTTIMGYHATGTCAIGQHCSQQWDCGVLSYCHESAVEEIPCVNGLCVDLCSDGIRDGFETDIDCGYAAPNQTYCHALVVCDKACATGKGCLNNGNCVSGRCVNGVCG